MGKKRWWQRLAYWLIKSDLESLKVFETVRTQVHEQSIRNLLILSNKELKQIWHENARYIICGYDIYHKIMECSSMMDCTISLKIEIDGQVRIFGIVVVFVPWMEGLYLATGATEMYCMIQGNKVPVCENGIAELIVTGERGLCASRTYSMRIMFWYTSLCSTLRPF